MVPKRILLIENRPDYGIGGVEKYNAKLSEIIAKNFPEAKLDKVCLLDVFNAKKPENETIYTTKFTKFLTKLEKKHKLLFYFLIGFHLWAFRRKIYKLNKQNNYDVIIDSTITYFSKFANLEKFLWIQHVTSKFYTHEYIKNNFVRKVFIFFKNLFSMKNPVLHYQNIICFDEENAKEIQQKRKDKFKLYDIHLFNKIYDYEKIKNSIDKRSKIIFFGRIENSQKNIKHLIELNKLLDYKIDFYGTGSESLIAKLGNSYKGIIQQKDLFDTITKYKASILLSRYEGFPFSVVQSLSAGLPVITNNTYCSAKFLVNKQKNGLLIETDDLLSQKELIQQFLELDEKKYTELCSNSYQFAKEYLTEENFETKWINLLSKYLK